MNAATDEAYMSFKRIATIGADANPHADDSCVLHENIRLLQRMYGQSFAAYVFTEDASRTSLRAHAQGVIPIDYLHRITEACDHDLQALKERHAALLAYQPGKGDDSISEVIHDIMSSVDILHILGGSYLSGQSPETMEEVHTLIKLAQHYGVRVLATGISVHPLHTAYAGRLYDILDACELVDFRDKSIKELDERFSRSGSTCKVQVTTDDALLFGIEAPKDRLPHALSTILATQKKRYASISLRSGKGAESKIALHIIRRVSAYIDEGLIDSAMLLAFDADEHDLYATILEKLDANPESFVIADLAGADAYAVQSVIAHAVMNICTRYRHTVSSLAARIPTFSIATSADDGFHMAEIHNAFESPYCAIADEIAAADLDAFAHSLPQLSDALRTSFAKVQESWQSKLQAIAKVYAGDDSPMEVLYERTSSPRQNKVSAIITTHGEETHLAKCLESVLNQNIDCLEVVCVDDESNDSTTAILCGYAASDSRVSIVSRSNLDINAARNVGLEKTSGEFVIFVDPADWLPTNSALSTLYWAAKEHDTLVSCGTLVFASEGDSKYSNPVAADPGLASSIRQSGFISFQDLQIDRVWTRFLYNRSFLVSNGLWFGNHRLGEESLWFARVMHATKVFYAVDVPVYCHRIGTSNAQVSYDEAVDLIDCHTSILEFSLEHGYDKLWARTIWHISNGFASIIAPHLASDQDDDRLDIAFERFTEIALRNGGPRNVVRHILNTYYKNQIASITPVNESLEEAEAKGFKAGVVAAASDLAAAEGRGFQIGVKTLQTEVAAAEDRSFRAGYAAAAPDIAAAEDRGYKAGFSLAESDLVAAEERGYRAGTKEILESKTYKFGHVFSAVPRKIKKHLSSIGRK